MITACNETVKGILAGRFMFRHEWYLRNMHSRGEVMGIMATAYYTAEMVRNLPEDGNRYETVGGMLLVTPAPNAWHQELVERIGDLVKGFAREMVDGHLFRSPADISWDEDTLVQPDLFVVPREQARGWDWRNMKDLILVVEVLSPSSVSHDRYTKRRLYQKVGVQEYWIVDPESETIEVWKPQDRFPTVYSESYEWCPMGSPGYLQVDLAQLFDRQLS
ncbi:MAG: Uma2 family endonuclease [Gemmatimonadota bacterium]|nr:Uma2 family endonuclease [Gemmatimonadota bacterium]